MAELESEKSIDLPPMAKDVTTPGAPESKTNAMKSVERVGNAPLLWSPNLNRGTNFTAQEREEHHLVGLLPPVVETLEQQAERVMLQVRMEKDPLEKYETLYTLYTTNETLFFYVVIHNLEELAPVIYTPTVGEACQKYDQIFQQPLGMYFSAFHGQRGKFYEIMRNWPNHKVQIIVVTDGGRILGLGDLGTNGMGISVGKIALYVAGGGFHPDHSLPACLDVGTDNEELLKDRFYLGTKEKRLSGDEHMAVIEEFCMAVQRRFPHALIQFEDFQTDKAFAILKKFRDKILCFNDDIQGTGAVVTTGFINGLKAQGTAVKDARVVFFGAGSSAVGVAQMICSLLQTEGKLSEEEAKQHIWMTDSKGLITTSRGDELPEHKQVMARRDKETPNMKDLKDIVAHVKPHALIGLTGGGSAWDQALIEELCKHCEKPLVFPLSNPTDKAEVKAEDAIKWSKGKCIVASGSPFDPVEYEGRKIVPGQANNVLIFPGVGFGAVMVKAKTIKDEMFIAAARALADYVSPEKIKEGDIYPDLVELRPISATVATAVAEAAFDLGVAGIDKPNDIGKYIRSKMWLPGKDTHGEQPDEDITGHKIKQSQ